MTTLKQLLLFLLVLLVAYRFVYYNSYIDEERVTITLDDLQITPPSPLPLLARREPGYEYLKLSLVWPNAFCNSVRSKERKCDPPQPRHQIFTIHGLWPNFYNGSYPKNCAGEQMKNVTLNKYKDQLMDYWPDLYKANSYENSMDFWKEEWKKHGTCSSNNFSQEEYLNKTLHLQEGFGPKILTELKNEGIKPDGNTTQSQRHILKTIYKATGKEAAVTFNKHISGISQILEIHLCFERDGVTLMDCKDTIFASTRSRTEDHGNDSENELEDAAELKLK